MRSLAWPSKDAYYRRLFGSHDFWLEVDVLDLNEKPVASATLLDGQVDIIASDNGVRRTASLTLIDDQNALDFGVTAAWSGTSLWVNRLVRVQHVIDVDGTDVAATCFVGAPTTIARNGAEVDVSLSDKAILANRGSKPYTVHKGADAVAAVKAIMADCTGEFHFRLPASTGRRLSKDYSVGWDDSASPFAVASRIASKELGWHLLYDASGYLMMRAMPTASVLAIPYVTEPPNTSVDFAGEVNWVQVTGKATTTTNKQHQTIKTQPQAIAQLAASDPLSPSSLARNGVPRYLPLLVSDDSLTSTAQVKASATAALKAGVPAKVTQEYSVIPVFNLDADDIVTLAVSGANPVVRVSTASIPLGVASDMTIGRTVISRKPPRVRSRVQKLRWRQTTKKTKHHWRDKKGKKHTSTSTKHGWKKLPSERSAKDRRV